MQTILKAAELLRQGNLVAIPTETVYGLAADITLDSAIKKIFALKGRPADHPLIIHISKIEQLTEYAKNIPAYVAPLIEKYWPGPLTLILPKTNRVSDLVTGGQDSVGIRMPAHPMALAVIDALGHAVAAPSANKFGHVSPTTAEHVRDEFGSALEVIDGGPCDIGIESTIVDATHPTEVCVLRKGKISSQQIQEAIGSLGVLVEKPHTEKRVSGHLKKHYAPRKPLILVSSLAELEQLSKEQSVYVLAHSALFQSILGVHRMPADPSAYAHQLYAELRRADASDSAIIALETPPMTSEWLAIHDRLLKAASPTL